MKGSQKISFVDDEFGDDFISSWKPALDFEDDERTPDNRKTSFSLQKMDMDFEFDGGLKDLSSFNVDISDLVPFPSKTGNDSEHNPKASDSVRKGNSKFCFEFDGLDDFDLEATLKTNKEPGPTSGMVFNDKENGDEPGQKTEERDPIVVDDSIFDKASVTKELPISVEASMDKWTLPHQSREQTIFDVSEGSRRILVEESHCGKISNTSSEDVIKDKTKRKSDERDTGSTKESCAKHIKERPMDTTSSSDPEPEEPNMKIAGKLDVSPRETRWLPPKKRLQGSGDAKIEGHKMTIQSGMKSRRGQDMEIPYIDNQSENKSQIQLNGNSGNAQNVATVPENMSPERKLCASVNLLDQGRNKQAAKKEYMESQIIQTEIRSMQSNENCIVKFSDSNMSLQQSQTLSDAFPPQSPRFVTGANLEGSPSKSEFMHLSMDDSENLPGLTQKSGLSSITVQPNKRNIQQALKVKSRMNSCKKTIAKRAKTIGVKKRLSGKNSGLVLLGNTKSAEPIRVASQKAFKYDTGIADKLIIHDENISQAKTKEDNMMETTGISTPNKPTSQNDVKSLESLEDISTPGMLQRMEDNGSAILPIHYDDKIEEKAESFVNQLDHLLKMLKQKHEEAMDLRVRALVINNTFIVLNNPMDDEKIQKITNYIHEKIRQKS